MVQPEAKPRGLSHIIGMNMTEVVKEFGNTHPTNRGIITAVETVPPEQTPDGTYEQAIITAGGHSIFYNKHGMRISTIDLDDGTQELIYVDATSGKPKHSPKKYLLTPQENPQA